MKIFQIAGFALVGWLAGSSSAGATEGCRAYCEAKLQEGKDECARWLDGIDDAKWQACMVPVKRDHQECLGLCRIEDRINAKNAKRKR
jgi:hypothetical protein